MSEVLNENTEMFDFDEDTNNLLITILEEIDKEVSRQIKLWGFDFDDKNTANDWCSYICNYVAAGAYAGRNEEYTPEKFRKNLKKAACLCISAMLTIDRNGDCAPRHYERLPNSGAKTNEKK